MWGRFVNGSWCSHDVSWGTKGDNTVSVDLGAAVGSKGDTVELEMPSEQLDIDSGYDDALRNLRDRLEVAEEPVSEGQIQEDYYRAVRTYVVVVWMVANAILAMVVTEAYSINEMSGNFYLKCKLSPWAERVREMEADWVDSLAVGCGGTCGF